MTPDEAWSRVSRGDVQDLFTHGLNTILVGNCVHINELSQDERIGVPPAKAFLISIFFIAETTSVEESNDASYIRRVVFWKVNVVCLALFEVILLQAFGEVGCGCQDRLMGSENDAGRSDTKRDDGRSKGFDGECLLTAKAC